MNEWIKLTEYNWAYWVAGLFALIEFLKWFIKAITALNEWLFEKVGIKTKRMLKREADEKRLKDTELAIKEIKETSRKNVEMFLEHERQTIDKIGVFKNEIVAELGRLHDKIEEQRVEMDKTNEANNKTDCAMLRDRIGSGMRYFSKNIGPDGKVHISLSDFENMNALFQEYFSKHGNGAFKKLYEDDFVHFIIDR